jgi:hypothetical protein
MCKSKRLTALVIRGTSFRKCGPRIDCIDTENGAPQIYAMGCGDDRASAARLRRANLSTTTCCAVNENDMLRNAVEGGDACTLSAEAHLLLPAVWVCFKCIGEARIAC